MNCNNCGSPVLAGGQFCPNCGSRMNAVGPPPPPPPPPAHSSPPPVQPAKKSSSGIWVAVGVGCFLAVIFLGIIAAIAIPNLLNAIQRAKQKRTMVDIRSIGIACEGYATDHHAYPDVDSVEELVPILEPKYIKKLPQMDAWNGILLYEARNNSGSSDGPDEYFIVSTGKDRLLDQEHLDYPELVSTTSFNNDIVFSNGEFIQYPQ